MAVLSTIRIAVNGGQARKELARIEGGFDRVANKIRNIGAAFGVGGGLLGFAGVFKALKDSVAAAGDIEILRVAFTNLSGSAEQADKIISQLRDSARKTGVTVNDQADAVRKFLALGFEPERALNLQKAILDVAGSMGLTSFQAGQLGFAISQVAAKGCHGIDTPIRLHDGNTKLVQDVRVGDLLMGPDGEPREVLVLARGRQEMFRITPKQGDPFIVNLDHKMRVWRDDKKITLTVRDYLDGPNKVTLEHTKLGMVGFEVESIGDGDFYGFNISGDHLYLDAQGFEHHNTVQMEELRQQISEKGVPIFQALSEKVNLFGADLQKAVRDGKIPAETLLQIFENYEGPFAKFRGGAEDIGKTVTGVFNRLIATITEVSQSLGAPIADAIKPALNVIQEDVFRAQNAIGGLGQAIGNAFRQANIFRSGTQVIEPLLDLSAEADTPEKIKEIINKIQDAIARADIIVPETIDLDKLFNITEGVTTAEEVKNAAKDITAALTEIGSVPENIGSGIFKSLQQLPAIASSVGNALGDVISVFKTLAQVAVPIGSVIGRNTGLIAQSVIAYTGFKTVLLAIKALDFASTITLSTGLTKKEIKAINEATGATSNEIAIKRELIKARKEAASASQIEQEQRVRAAKATEVASAASAAAVTAQKQATAEYSSVATANTQADQRVAAAKQSLAKATERVKQATLGLSRVRGSGAAQGQQLASLEAKLVKLRKSKTKATLELQQAEQQRASIATAGSERIAAASAQETLAKKASAEATKSAAAVDLDYAAALDKEASAVQKAAAAITNANRARIESTAATKVVTAATDAYIKKQQTAADVAQGTANAQISADQRVAESKQNLVSATNRVAEAQATLDSISKSGAETASQVSRAEEQLASSRDRRKNAISGVIAAERELSAAQQTGAFAASAAEKKLTEARAELRAANVAVERSETNLANTRNQVGRTALLGVAKAEKELTAAKQAEVAATDALKKAEADRALAAKRGSEQVTLANLAETKAKRGLEAATVAATQAQIALTAAQSAATAAGVGGAVAGLGGAERLRRLTAISASLPLDAADAPARKLGARIASGVTRGLGVGLKAIPSLLSTALTFQITQQIAADLFGTKLGEAIAKKVVPPIDKELENIGKDVKIGGIPVEELFNIARGAREKPKKDIQQIAKEIQEEINKAASELRGADINVDDLLNIIGGAESIEELRDIVAKIQAEIASLKDIDPVAINFDDLYSTIDPFAEQRQRIRQAREELESELAIPIVAEGPRIGLERTLTTQERERNENLQFYIGVLDRIESQLGDTSIAEKNAANRASELSDSITQQIEEIRKLESAFNSLEQQTKLNEQAAKQYARESAEGQELIKAIQRDIGDTTLILEGPERANETIRGLTSELDELESQIQGVEESDLGSADKIAETESLRQKQQLLIDRIKEVRELQANALSGDEYKEAQKSLIELTKELFAARDAYRATLFTGDREKIISDAEVNAIEDVYLSQLSGAERVNELLQKRKDLIDQIKDAEKKDDVLRLQKELEGVTADIYQSSLQAEQEIANKRREARQERLQARKDELQQIRSANSEREQLERRGVRFQSTNERAYDPRFLPSFIEDDIKSLEIEGQLKELQKQTKELNLTKAEIKNLPKKIAEEFTAQGIETVCPTGRGTSL